MPDWVEMGADTQHRAREKAKARQLRASQWWRNLVARGVCHYCEGACVPETLTMDHIVPIARGGRSTRGNVVPCCKSCNTQKKYWTPAELVLHQLRTQATETPP